MDLRHIIEDDRTLTEWEAYHRRARAEALAAGDFVAASAATQRLRDVQTRRAATPAILRLNHMVDRFSSDLPDAG